MSDEIQQLNNRINDAVKRLSFLKPDELVHVQTTITRQIKDYVSEKGDPFKPLTESLGPVFNHITTHEKNLAHIVNDLRIASTGFGKMAKNKGVYPNLTVRQNSRIVVKEFPEGTILRKEVYTSTRPTECSECKGTGFIGHIPGKTKKCKTCKGSGKTYPIRGVMLEVIM